MGAALIDLGTLGLALASLSEYLLHQKEGLTPFHMTLTARILFETSKLWEAARVRTVICQIS